MISRVTLLWVMGVTDLLIKSRSPSVVQGTICNVMTSFFTLLRTAIPANFLQEVSKELVSNSNSMVFDFCTNSQTSTQKSKCCPKRSKFLNSDSVCQTICSKKTGLSHSRNRPVETRDKSRMPHHCPYKL